MLAIVCAYALLVRGVPLARWSILGFASGLAVYVLSQALAASLVSREAAIAVYRIGIAFIPITAACAMIFQLGLIERYHVNRRWAQFALASGANFVARAFSGDPNGTADILAQALRHPGFSFVEILSPCVTFRPEQREWKSAVHAAPVAPTDDPARAARRIMTDDGFNIGVLYAGGRTPYPLDGRGARSTPAELEAEFAL